MNRRDFLLGATALATTAAVPALPLTPLLTQDWPPNPYLASLLENPLAAPDTLWFELMEQMRATLMPYTQFKQFVEP